MQIVIDIPEKYYKDAKRMVWSSTYSGSLISGWLRNAIPVTEKDGYFVTDSYDYTDNMCTTQDRRCDSCEHSEEQDGLNCYECVKGMADNFEAQPKIGYIPIDVNKLAKEVAEKALDEITYEGKTIREWAEILVKQQPCEDCISRQAVIDLTWDWESFTNITRHDGLSTLREMRTKIEDLPFVTPQRLNGKWIDDCGGVTCSCCGYSIDDNYYAKTYCTNCGAEMEE